MKTKMKNKAFTLIEILVTTTIFVSIFGMISGLFFSALKVQRKALSSQGLIRESSYVMEYMGRQLRMAQKSDLSHNCAGLSKNYLIGPEGDSITFRNYDDECWTFFLSENRLKASRSGIEDFLTSEDLEVLFFDVYLSGDETSENPNLQPRITLSLRIRGRGFKQEQTPEIQIQTTLSQRNLDF